MLGTGNAMVTRCYNTCFVLRNQEDCLLVDAGGGNGYSGADGEKPEYRLKTYMRCLSPMDIQTMCSV